MKEKKTKKKWRERKGNQYVMKWKLYIEHCLQPNTFDKRDLMRSGRAWMATKMSRMQQKQRDKKCVDFKSKVIHFIMAAGPPPSISSRTGFRAGSSRTWAIRCSSCSLWAGLVKFEIMPDIAGSCNTYTGILVKKLWWRCIKLAKRYEGTSTCCHPYCWPFSL